MPLDNLFKISDRFETRISNALMSAFQQIRDSVSLAQIETALREQGIVGALNILNALQIENQVQASVVAELEDAVRESGRIAIELIPSAARTGSLFVFRSAFTETSRLLENYSLSLVQQISTETRGAIREAIANDFIAGRNPRDTARVFRNTVGLTRRQELAVRNYERALRELNPQALQRQLRDRRFDRTVLRSIQSGQQLPELTIQRLTQRYRERYIRHRTETIARTESLRAVSIGQHQSIVQAAFDGAIDPQQIRRFWVYTRDSRTRPTHRAIPGLNPEGVAIDQPFQTPLGPLLYPRDPNGSGANTINCRCAVVYRLVNLETGQIIGEIPMTHNVRRAA